MTMLRTQNEDERRAARETLEEVMRKLEEALALSRELERERAQELCHRG